MITKRFRFTFIKPIVCYDDLISEDTVIAADLETATRILMREHCHARIKDVFVSDIELYGREPPRNRFNAYSQSVMHTGRLLNEDVD